MTLFSIGNGKMIDNQQHITNKLKHASHCGSLAVCRGFTLVEMLVATALFAVVIMIGVGALLSIVAADRKAQAFKSVMNNLNFAMEGMARSIRVGSNYRCGSGQDCPGGGTKIAFKSSAGPDVVYQLSGTQIQRSDAGAPFVGVTAPEVVVESLRFYVNGTAIGDKKQPTVLLLLRGHAGVSARAQTSFSIETFIAQRAFDE